MTFARTETRMFFDSVWPRANAIFFFKGRLKFYGLDGKPGGTAGAPSVLVSYSPDDSQCIKYSGLEGKIFWL